MNKSKSLNFPINNKVFTVDVGEDLNNEIENGIRKFLDLESNLNTQDILLAYIKKTHELVELEKSLEDISEDINTIANK